MGDPAARLLALGSGSRRRTVRRQFHHRGKTRSGDDMRFAATSGALGVLAITIGLMAGTTADSSELTQATIARTSDSSAARTPLILTREEGERRIRRVMGGALAIIKVDRRNGGSPGLVMGYEEIPPGQAIQA